jgi:CDP-diacylglycerol--glycerol-3-phosphate 3-phosphatidyltransferase
MRKPAYYIVNGLTLYRLIAAPVIIILIFTHLPEIFKWLLALSFFTDAIDGFLARRERVTSIFGSKLDSVADDLTILAALVGIVVYKWDFILEKKIIIIILLFLYLLQNSLALVRYKKITSFHTYSAKVAAVFQGIFLILVFFTEKPNEILFYAAVVLTIIDLLEEIILVLLLSEWKTNVRGLYWVLKTPNP